MSKLPEKYPEYIIMYKILSKKMSTLQKINTIKNKEIQIKIKNYKIEMDKIKQLFPENFFDGFKNE